MFFSIFFVLNIHAHIFFSPKIIQCSFIPTLYDAIHENWSTENQQVLNCLPQMSEIIRLAKNSAEKLDSPPRIYQTSGNSISLWPDQPGERETTYGTGGMQRPGQDSMAGMFPMKLRTVVESTTPQGSYEVIFESEWGSPQKKLIHVWKFYVDADCQVTFIGEEGDALPPLPM